MAKTEVFIGQTEFLRAKEQGGVAGMFLNGNRRGIQPLQRLLGHAANPRAGTDDQGAIGQRFGQVREDARALQHVGATDSRHGLAKRWLIGIDQAEIGNTEIGHGTGGGADVERVADVDEDDGETGEAGGFDVFIVDDGVSLSRQYAGRYSDFMARGVGVADGDLSLKSRLIFWLIRRRMKRITQATRLRAHHPALLEYSSRMDQFVGNPGLVPVQLKELAQVKVAAMVGCPF